VPLVPPLTVPLPTPPVEVPDVAPLAVPAVALEPLMLDAPVEAVVLALGELPHATATNSKGPVRTRVLLGRIVEKPNYEETGRSAQGRE